MTEQVEQVEQVEQQTMMEKLDLIIELLTRLTSAKEQPTSEPVEPSNDTIHLNKSKFVNETQRQQILSFIKLDPVRSTIKSLPKHKQASTLQSMIKKEFGVDLSYYMSVKLCDSMK